MSQNRRWSILVVILTILTATTSASGAGASEVRGQPGFMSADEAVAARSLDASVLRSLRREGRVKAIVSFNSAQTLAKAQEAASAAKSPGMAPTKTMALRTQRILAVTKPIYAFQKERAFAEVRGVSVIDEYEVLPTAAVVFTSESALERVLNDPLVEGVRADERMQSTLAQSLPLIGQPTVYGAGHTGAGTAVAVLDSGVDYTHSAFGSCISPGGACKVAYAADFAPDDGLRDDDGHGTNVAGIAVGVAPGTKILALDVFDGGGAYTSDILSAINWTISTQGSYGTRAMNMSLGSLNFSTTVCASAYAGPFASARAVGILPVLASGNSAGDYGGYTDGVAFPACTAGAVRVGAVYDSNVGGTSFSTCADASTSSDKVTCFSQGGPLLSLLAPGGAIAAAGFTMYGTSQAAPHVAGAVAVLADASPGATAAEIEAALSTTGPLISDPRSGLSHHRLSLPASVAALAGGSTLSVNDVTQAEGNSGTTAFTFTVTLSPASASTVTVRVDTCDAICDAFSTAVSPGDFTATGQTLTFSPGQTSKSVTVNVNGDTQGEPSEVFTLDLSSPTGGATLDSPGFRYGIGTITNDDSGGSTLSVNDVTQTEGNSGTTAFTFTVTLSPASVSTVTVRVDTCDAGCDAFSTAVSPGDFAATGQTLTFSPGQTSKSVAVNVNGDTQGEPSEVFTLDLSSPTGGATLDSPSFRHGIGTITNDDSGTAAPTTTSAVLTGGYKWVGSYRYYHVGTTRKITTTVSPDHTGNNFLLYVNKWNGSQWVSVSGSPYPKTLGVGSKHTTPASPGKGTYKAWSVFAGDADHLGSQSPYAYYKFTR